MTTTILQNQSNTTGGATSVLKNPIKKLSKEQALIILGSGIAIAAVSYGINYAIGQQYSTTELSSVPTPDKLNSDSLVPTDSTIVSETTKPVFNTPVENTVHHPISKAESLVVTVPDELHLASNISDDMSFKEAFDAARSEVGSGHFFQWHNEFYNTYTRAEWEQLSDTEHDLFVSRLKTETGNHEYAPDEIPTTTFVNPDGSLDLQENPQNQEDNNETEVTKFDKSDDDHFHSHDNDIEIPNSELVETSMIEVNGTQVEATNIDSDSYAEMINVGKDDNGNVLLAVDTDNNNSLDSIVSVNANTQQVNIVEVIEEPFAVQMNTSKTETIQPESPQAESEIIEIDGHKAEIVDLSGDGKADIAVIDKNDDSAYDTFLIDADKNGKLDTEQAYNPNSQELEGNPHPLHEEVLITMDDDTSGFDSHANVTEY